MNDWITNPTHPMHPFNPASPVSMYNWQAEVRQPSPPPKAPTEYVWVPLPLLLLLPILFGLLFYVTLLRGRDS